MVGPPQRWSATSSSSSNNLWCHQSLQVVNFSSWNVSENSMGHVKQVEESLVGIFVCVVYGMPSICLQQQISKALFSPTLPSIVSMCHNLKMIQNIKLRTSLIFVFYSLQFMPSLFCAQLQPLSFRCCRLLRSQVDNLVCGLETGVQCTSKL